MMRNSALLVALAVLVGACGSGSETEPVTDDEVVTTVSSATSTTTMATTTTTVATTTTTEADPQDMIAAEVAARGIASDMPLEEIIALEDSICVTGADEVDSTHLTDLESWAAFGLPGLRPLGGPAQGELVALVVETFCPEHVDKLGFSADQYADARTADLHPGDCFLINQIVMVPVGCDVGHDGEVVSFVDASEKDFPTPQEGGFGWFDDIDCRTPQLEYVGEHTSLSYMTRRMAANQQEWDGGETRVMCAISANGRILQGSARGMAGAINEVAESVTFNASICTLESLEATLTNDASVDVGVSISLRNYYPEGMRFEMSYPLIAAGETVTISNTYELVEGDPPPAECTDPFLTVVPVPLG